MCSVLSRKILRFPLSENHLMLQKSTNCQKAGLFKFGRNCPVRDFNWKINLRTQRQGGRAHHDFSNCDVTGDHAAVRALGGVSEPQAPEVLRGAEQLRRHQSNQKDEVARELQNHTDSAQ